MLAVVFVLSFLTGAAVLQTPIDPISMNGGLSPECLGYGAVIALLVQLLKRFHFVANNPKAVASILSILTVLIPIFVHGGADFKVIAYCVIAQLTVSIGTYEIAATGVAMAKGNPS
ncbi:MAG: hypothetical protein ACRDRF_00645 [Pseudonocardiaceae bacterium]